MAQRISAELKRYSIPQAIFAQRVLCRSQGTLSDLLRNPKPWSKLKSGRETFRRMFKWLQEPEFQRMSALRMAGKYILMFLFFVCLLCIKIATPAVESIGTQIEMRDANALELLTFHSLPNIPYKTYFVQSKRMEKKERKKIGKKREKGKM